MLKYIQTFLPMAIEAQFKIIDKYGFTPNNDGIKNKIILNITNTFLNK